MQVLLAAEDVGVVDVAKPEGSPSSGDRGSFLRSNPTPHRNAYSSSVAATLLPVNEKLRYTLCLLHMCQASTFLYCT